MLEVGILILAFVGAALQAAIGVGFSVVVAPAMIAAVGAMAAVPKLIALNLIISLIAVLSIGRADWRASVSAMGWAIPGLIVGGLTVHALSADTVTLVVAALLIAGALPLARFSTGHGAAVPIASSLAGLATVWTATPGPLMALGFVWARFDAVRIRALVQPFACICYALALLLHGANAPTVVREVVEAPGLLGVVAAGAIAGIGLGERVPAQLVIPAIRIVALAGGLLLIGKLLLNSRS